MKARSKEKVRIIIFDGVCAFCNGSIHILIKLDRQKIFKYTSLQGKFIKTLDMDPDIDSIIYYEDHTLYYKSTAILKILNALGGLWVLSAIFYLIPKIIRDFIYDSIAKYRYKLFGRLDSCRMPKEEEQELFIA